MENKNMNIEACKLEEINSSQFQNSKMIQFPQPTRPINSYNFETPEFPSETVSMINNMIFQSSSSSGDTIPIKSHDNHQPTTAAGEEEEEEEEEEETSEEVLKLFSELHENLPRDIRSQLNLDPSNKLKGLKVYSTSTRGGNGPLEEMKRKLERIKIRTVQLGGGGTRGGER